MTKKLAFILGLLIGVVFSMIITIAAIGASATVSWDANTESDLSGYKIYYGTSSGSYDDVLDVGNKTSSSINNLVVGTTYFFVVTAYDFSGNESGFSDEVSFTPTEKDTTEDPPTEDSTIVTQAYCFPNPFLSSEGTTINFFTPVFNIVSIDIFTVTGRLIKNLIKNEAVISGEHQFRWNGKDQYENLINPGIYFGVLTLSSQTIVIKMAVKP